MFINKNTLLINIWVGRWTLFDLRQARSLPVYRSSQTIHRADLRSQSLSLSLLASLSLNRASVSSLFKPFTCHFTSNQFAYVIFELTNSKNLQRKVRITSVKSGSKKNDSVFCQAIQCTFSCTW